MLKVGDKLPAGTLSEFIEVESNGCSLGPNTFQVADLVKGKKIAIFGLPGAYTPTCSAQHVPGYVKHAAELKELQTTLKDGGLRNSRTGSMLVRTIYAARPCQWTRWCGSTVFIALSFNSATSPTLIVHFF